jgi:hypothetical protein
VLRLLAEMEAALAPEAAVQPTPQHRPRP